MTKEENLKTITDEELIELIDKVNYCRDGSYSEKYQTAIIAEFEKRMKYDSLGRFKNVKKIRTKQYRERGRKNDDKNRY